MSEPPAGYPLHPTSEEDWDAAAVRALRQRLGDTQATFADRLGTTQQTVSEWERGARRPRRMARRLLHLVAEQAAPYEAGRAGGAGDAHDR